MGRRDQSRGERGFSAARSRSPRDNRQIGHQLASSIGSDGLDSRDGQPRQLDLLGVEGLPRRRHWPRRRPGPHHARNAARREWKRPGPRQGPRAAGANRAPRRLDAAHPAGATTLPRGSRCAGRTVSLPGSGPIAQPVAEKLLEPVWRDARLGATQGLEPQLNGRVEQVEGHPEPLGRGTAYVHGYSLPPPRCARRAGTAAVQARAVVGDSTSGGRSARPRSAARAPSATGRPTPNAWKTIDRPSHTSAKGGAWPVPAADSGTTR